MLTNNSYELSSAFPTFRVFLLRIFGNDTEFKLWGKTRLLPYAVKCWVFGIFLYLPGLIISYIEGPNVSADFITNFGFLVASIIVGIALWALVRFFREVDCTIRRLDVVFLRSNKADIERFFDEVRTTMYKGTALARPSPFWYYLESFGGAFIGFALSYFGIIYPKWVQPVLHPTASLLPTLYLHVWCTIVAYVIGVAVWRTGGAVWAIREYCKRFIVPEKIVALSPDKTGGLKILGDLALKLDIGVAIPSVVVLAYMSEGPVLASIFPGPAPPPSGPFLNIFGICLTTIYTIFLAGVFFLPLSPAHNAMLEGKNNALQEINVMFRTIYSMIKERYFHTEQFKSGPLLADLHELYFIYEQTKKMAVWPLNFGLVSKFFLTSSFPLVGTFVFDVILKLLFPG